MLTLGLGLAACGDGNPISGDGPGDGPDDGRPGGPQVQATGEVTGLRFDADADQIVVEDLPFDGEDGVYTRVAETTALEDFGVYESRSGTEEGRRKYYAVFRETDSGAGSVAAIASPDYQDVGFGGTVATRNGTTDMPTAGEYVYTGVYGGVRTPEGRTGIELTEGDVLLEIDVADFDGSGAIEGRIGDRTRYRVDGTALGALPDVVFRTTSISEGGVIDAGDALTRNNDGTERDNGTYQGLFVGEDGEEIVGSVTLDGTFYSSRVQETYRDQNGQTATRMLSYEDYLDLRDRAADGDPGALARFGNTTVIETAEDFDVQERGVFTAAD